MLIGVVSDTHRDETALKKVVEEIKNLDVVIHLGDNVVDAEEIKDLINNKIVYVKGNCDIMANEPTELIEEFHGVRILITHGHKYNVKNTLTELKCRAQQLEA
ncbi:MAG: YfcE family phosphodiesterase, partial [Clostridium sp.]|nr:YfcE family phosphodiesterase [Clostridium sp.]